MLHFSDLISYVRNFHEAFLLPIQRKPSLIESERYDLRYKLMHEENEEYLDACRKGDLTAIADALGDQLYVLIGTLIEHGLQDKIEDIFLTIHRSNLSKLDESGLPIFREDGKVMKSKLYFPPRIQEVLEKQTMMKFIQSFRKTCSACGMTGFRVRTRRIYGAPILCPRCLDDSRIGDRR